MRLGDFIRIGGPFWSIEKSALEGLLAYDGPPPDRQMPMPRVISGVAIIPVIGELTPAGQMGGEIGTSTVATTALVRAAAASPAVHSILLDINSPGGTVVGTAGLADAVYRAARDKKVVALGNSLVASAAYWVASQASEVVGAIDSDWGSLGVWAMHANQAGALEQAGVEVTIISSAPFKTEGHPWGPLSEAAADYMQSRVDDQHQDFVAAVARGRKRTPETVEKTFGKGRIYGAKEAVARGMIDRIEGPDTILSKLLPRRGASAAMSLDSKHTRDLLTVAYSACGLVVPDFSQQPARMVAVQHRDRGHGDPRELRRRLEAKIRRLQC